MYTLKKQGQQLVYKVVDPFIKLLHKMGVTPNGITLIGLVINMLAAVVFVYGAEQGNRFDFRYVGAAGAIILFAGLFDMLDGRLARLTGQESTFGALFDSVLDRYSELVMFFGICYYLVTHDYFLSSIFAFFAMIGSIMVSYTRARAEGLGANASVGLMQRPERILLVGVSAICCGIFAACVGSDYKIMVEGFQIPLFETMTIFTFPIFILAIMSNITALQRLMQSKEQLQ